MLLSWEFGMADAGCDQFTGIGGSLGVSGPAVVVRAQEAITCSAYNALMFGMALEAPLDRRSADSDRVAPAHIMHVCELYQKVEACAMSEAHVGLLLIAGLISSAKRDVPHIC